MMSHIHRLNELGVKLGSIATYLNERGYKTFRGKRWTIHNMELLYQDYYLTHDPLGIQDEIKLMVQKSKKQGIPNKNIAGALNMDGYVTKTNKPFTESNVNDLSRSR